MSPDDVAVAEDAVVRDGMDSEVFFADVFQNLTEYEEIATINIADYLKTKTNKQDALESYLDELSQQMQKAQITLQKLQAQSTFHKTALQNIQTDIKNTQTRIESAYTDRNSTAIVDGMADLDELVLQKQDHIYGQLLNQQLAREYQSVITFAQKKWDIIRANMPAFVQGITVTLPEWNTLKDLEQLQIFSRENI